MDDKQALDELINEAVEQEKALTVRAEELSLQSKQFADYLKEKKHNDEKLEVLWDMVKDYMIEHDIRQHETDYIKLSLSPSGRYRLTEEATIDDVPDEICDTVKVINNKKVKAYSELHGDLPSGVELTGYVLRKKLKGSE